MFFLFDIKIFLVGLTSIDSAWNNDIGFSNIFGNSSSALSGYEIEDIKKLGLGDYAPKILTIAL